MTLNLPKYSEYLLLVTLMWMLPDIAHAGIGGTNSVAKVLCGVASILWGPVGSVIAMLGVVAIGLIAMFGKIQISSVLTVLTGIAIIFGAQGILGSLGVTVDCSSMPPAAAMAIATSEFYNVIGCILSWFVGPIGKAIASLALILVGLFATYGRISWHQGLLVAIGLATMFGSVSIVQSLGVSIQGGGSLQLASLCSSGAGLSLESVFCNVHNWFHGPIGKGIATVGLIVLGLGALFGKSSWGIAVVYAVGLSLIFGSQSIIVALGGHQGTAAICTP